MQGLGMTSRRARQRLINRLRDRGITDEEVLAAMLETPRHWFVDEALASRAYEDSALPIGFGQTLSQPHVVAWMTMALFKDGPRARVLEIGTGSGYQVAVLARLAERVYSVERIGRLLEQARERIRALGLSNVRLKYDDGVLGWPRYAPFDAIMITAAAEQIPEPLVEQLSPGGRLLAPVGGSGGQQELFQLDRRAYGVERRSLGPVSFVPLLGGVL
jgi:protein-L-isoaspartate(D-aspartate) O-methyltransferase